MQATTDAAAEDFAAAVESAKLQALYNFAYGLSHEINNPLANIATRAQTLLADEKNSERRRKLATIVQQAFRAHEMIADLMLFARPPTLKCEPTDLTKLADSVLAELQDQARDQKTQLIRTGDPGPLIAFLDPTQIAVALKAIVQNGLEAVKNEGRVVVELRTDPVLSTQYSVLTTHSDYQRIDQRHATAPPLPLSPSGLNSEPRTLNPLPPPPHSALRAPHLVLTVSDTGPGIPEHIRPHIFDPFYSGREAGRGLGLGLSKAWRIINLHGGLIDVDSPAGQGATFEILLPGQERS
jgi:signal transduction histidine kinase